MLTNWLSVYDLVPAFMLASLFGVVLCVRAMIDVAHSRIGPRDGPGTSWLRRMGLLVLGLALLESLAFGHEMSWQPWPPHLLLILGLNMWLFSSILSARQRNKSTMKSTT